MRRVVNGKVTSSGRIVWRISEGDIIRVAKERGASLNEEQLEKLSKHFDRNFAPNAEWHDIIEQGLDDLSITSDGA